MPLLNKCQMATVSKTITKFDAENEQRMLNAILAFGNPGLSIRDSSASCKELVWHDRSIQIDLSAFWNIYKEDLRRIE